MIIKLDGTVIIIFSYLINLSNSLIILKLDKLSNILPTPDRNQIGIKEKNYYKIIKNQHDEEKNKPKYQNPEQLLTKNDVLNKNFNNKILIKRIIPHGLESTGIEYDQKYGTFYKPLIRIHKRKQDSSLKDRNYQEISFILPNEPKFEHFELKKLKDDILDQELFTPFRIPQANVRKNDFKVLKKLQKLIKYIKSKTNRVKAYNKVIKVLQNMLRSPQFEKSGEDNDPFAPGKAILAEDRELVNTEKPKVWIPHYPPWNYWTYKKTIHEDVCPGSQVKMGNLCIWIPPH